MHPRPRLAVSLLIAAIAFGAAGCQPDEPQPPAPETATTAVDEAPPSPEVRGSDPTAAPIERAAPPMLQPVVLGEFLAEDDPAKLGTGSLHVEDGRILGANGAVFVTERIALVRGDDEYAKGARYSDVLMVGGEQPVELRRVVQETMPDAGEGTSFCGAQPTAYLALARLMGPDGRESLRMIALQGADMPAPSSSGVALCQSAQYIASL